MKHWQNSDKSKENLNQALREPSARQYQQNKEQHRQQNIQKCQIIIRNIKERGIISTVDDNGQKMLKIEKKQSNKPIMIKSNSKKPLIELRISDITSLKISDSKLIIKAQFIEDNLKIYFTSKEIAKYWQTCLLEIAPHLKDNKNTKREEPAHVIKTEKPASRKKENVIMDISFQTDDFDNIDQSAIAIQSPLIGQTYEERALLKNIRSIFRQEKRTKQANLMIEAQMLTLKEYYRNLYIDSQQKLSFLSKDNDELKKKLVQLEIECIILRWRLVNSQSKNNEKQQRHFERDKLQNLIASLQSQKENNRRIKIQLASLTRENDKHKEDKQRQCLQISKQWQSKCKQMTKELKSISLSQQKLKEEMEICHKDMRQLSKDNQFLQRELKQSQHNYIFDGNVLGTYNAQKMFLKEAIQTFTSQNIIKTRIIYKYDPLSNVNFHEYIDNHAHIVIIVKTRAGALLAAFTEGPFRRNQTNNQRGLLFSLTNMKTFELIQGRRAITYDDFYIIFGNSEFRIRSQQKKIFSNFGIGNGYFNSKNHKVDILLQEGNSREVDIDDYEVHEIIYR